MVWGGGEVGVGLGFFNLCIVGFGLWEVGSFYLSFSVYSLVIPSIAPFFVDMLFMKLVIFIS